jgi:integrase/recombinase XerD
MTTRPISPLRQRMIEDMNARKRGRHCQRSHLASCERFAAFLQRSPETATADDVRHFSCIWPRVASASAIATGS